MTDAGVPWKKGQALEPLTLPAVTRLDLIKYAGASGDYNPIHTIDEEAERAGLPGVIQHGMLTMAQIGRLVSPYFSHGWITRFHIRFRGMVFIGDVLSISGSVTSVAESAEGERFTIDLAARTADDRTVATGTLEFLSLEGGGT